MYAEWQLSVHADVDGGQAADTINQFSGAGNPVIANINGLICMVRQKLIDF